MSRKKKKAQMSSMYLHPEMDEIMQAAKTTAERPGYLTGSLVSQGWQEARTVKTFHNHYGDEMICDYMGKQLYGGKVGDVELYGFDLVIDCAGLPAEALSPFVKVVPKGFEELSALVKMPQVMRLNWKDYSWPNIGIEFWMKLWTLLPPMTLICCVGGHGRTGTCAAALMVASGGWKGDEAVKWVQKHYCKEAIETEGQQQYVESLYKERKELV